MIDTACSTSLVAVHLACASLRSGESDYAFAGGVSVFDPVDGGYVYEPGMIYADDGVCRPFDERATGTVGGDGAGVVLLRRLSDALRDGDPVHAVIVGSAVNNDGRARAGYAAPGFDGQVTVIRRALASARVEGRDIGFAETHGTGTRGGELFDGRLVGPGCPWRTCSPGRCGSASPAPSPRTASLALLDLPERSPQVHVLDLETLVASQPVALRDERRYRFRPDGLVTRPGKPLRDRGGSVLPCSGRPVPQGPRPGPGPDALGVAWSATTGPPGSTWDRSIRATRTSKCSGVPRCSASKACSSPQEQPGAGRPGLCRSPGDGAARRGLRGAGGELVTEGREPAGAGPRA